MNYDFLNEVISHRSHVVYARVILLNLDETPIETIEGRITSGSINVDGASAVRRTCSFSMVSSVLDTSAYQWGIHSKFSFEVGLENPFFGTEKNWAGAPQIIWFKQGIYVCTSYSSSISTTGYTINLQGKDKMCLLNGDVGGTLPALSTDFDKIENITAEYTLVELSQDKWYAGKYYIQLEDGSYELSVDYFDSTATYYVKNLVSDTEKIWIGDVVKEMVHTYGNEPYHNIIIQDVAENGVELWEYRGDKTMFMLVRCSTYEVENLILDDETTVYWLKNGIGGGATQVHLYDLVNSNNKDYNDPEYFKFLTLNTLTSDGQAGMEEYGLIQDPYDNEDAFYLMKFEYGDLVGYHATPLVYPDDLTAAVGNSITSVLDNITKTFGNYEYFYDLDGHFIFQKKKSQIQTESLGLTTIAQRRSEVNSNEMRSDIIFDNTSLEELRSYNYQDSKLFTQFSITPQLSNIKNDYSIWGTRSSVSNSNVPVHYRFAVSEKPIEYTSIQTGITYYNIEEFGDGDDWRELIYQMAEDYYACNQDDDFLAKVGRANPTYYPTGYTGYEPFYQDMQAFWRQIYRPEDEWVMQKKTVNADNFASMVSVQPIYVVDTDSGIADYVRLENTAAYDEGQTYYERVKKNNEGDGHWHVDVLENPTTINYWLDFCNSGDLAKFSIQRLGGRAKAVNDSTVKSIYYEEAPNVLFAYIDEERDRTMTGYTYLLINRSMEDLFQVAAVGKSAKEALTSLLNESAFVAESLSITSVPIYYLDVNTKIQIADNDRGINGEYLVSKLTIPLAYNGTMSITATNIINGIY